jgi:hypothetical protein
MGKTTQDLERLIQDTAKRIVEQDPNYNRLGKLSKATPNPRLPRK